MANFFERNRKKSVLGALLLLFRERKGVSLLLLAVALASSLFLAPSWVLTSFPGGRQLAAAVAWTATRLGVDVSRWGFTRGSRGYGDFIAALRAAKAGEGRPAGWGAFFSESRRKGGKDGDSLGLVKGRREDLEGGVREGKDLGSRETVAGILDPADAGESEGGVALDGGDLLGRREGLVREAQAGGFLIAGQRGAVAKGELALGGGAFAGKDFFAGGASASGAPGGSLRRALETTDSGPVPRGRVQGGSNGRLSASRASVISARHQRGLSGAYSVNSHRAFAQLADGRGRAAVSTPPECNAPGCPGEFPAHNTGAIYDGYRVNASAPDILTVDAGVPALPDTSAADGYMQQAAQMEKDAKTCRDADDRYTPDENRYMADLERISNEFEAMNCGGGGCSKSKAKRCKRKGDELKAACRRYADVRCQHTMACPLTAKNGCSSNACTGGMRSTGAQRENGAVVVPGG